MTASQPQTVLVTGESMWPRLVPGQHYRLEPPSHLRQGMIVVFSDPLSPSGYLAKEIHIVRDRILIVGGLSSSSTWKISKKSIAGILREKINAS